MVKGYQVQVKKQVIELTKQEAVVCWDILPPENS